MSLTPSKMIPLGTSAPKFNLQDVVSGKKLSLEDSKGTLGTLIMFICAHCPFVKHLEKEVSFFAKNYKNKGLNCVAICSNDAITHPDDSPQKLKMQALKNDFCFPYLVDETQDIAKAYGATCTPDFFLFDKNLKCVYRGRFDSSTPGNNQPITGDDLRNAVEAMMKGETIQTQKPSLGCNIKWKN